jgi:hypothetical protein
MFKHGDLPVPVPPVPVPVPVPPAPPVPVLEPSPPVAAAPVVLEAAVQLNLSHLDLLAQSAETDPSYTSDLVVLGVPEDPDRNQRSRGQSKPSPAGAGKPRIDGDYAWQIGSCRDLEVHPRACTSAHARTHARTNVGALQLSRQDTQVKRNGLFPECAPVSLSITHRVT